MSVVASVKAGPTAAQVRAWGREQNAQGADLPGTAEGTRGRLNPALVKAYNAAHKGANAYREDGPKVGATVEVTAKPPKGRAVKRTVEVSAARAAIQAAGFEVGARGRLPRQALEAYVLGTLGQAQAVIAETA